MNNNYRIFALLMILFPSFATADLNDEIDLMFDDVMINVTPTGKYQDSSRGVLTGGRFSLRQRNISAPKLITFEPPAFSAGCGGIDMYGGSFSFISGTELQNYLRSIASNASTYAFSLALEGMCPTCKQVMNDLQNITNKMNALLKNSCNTAKSIVDGNFIDDFTTSTEELGKSIYTATGLGDRNETENPTDAISPPKKVTVGAPVEAEKLKGNVIWDILKASDVADWYTAGDDDLLMTIMSITGTVVIGDVGTDQPNITTHPAKKIKPMQFLNGDTVEYYKCTEVIKCIDIDPTQTITLNGIEDKILKLIFGDPGVSIGILAKFNMNVSETLTDAEQSFLENGPAIVSKTIYMASSEPGLAEQALRMSAKIIASLAVEVLMNEIFDSVMMAARSKAGLPSEYIDSLYKVKSEYKADLKSNDEDYAKVQELFSIYSLAAQIKDKTNYNPLIQDQLKLDAK